MAVYVQPYNPWKEQAALSLLGGFIDKLQQTEQNRKTNAFRGQLQQNLASQTGANDNISLMPQNVPQGYNDNPWANAFHKTDNPLTQFNIGTAGSIARLPTMSEIANMGASLGASKRFSGLNPDTVQKIIAEMAQANEAQRMTDLRSQYANQFGEAGSFGDQMKAIAGLAMHGGIPYQAIGQYAGVRPYPQQSLMVDSGDAIRPSTFNSETGAITLGKPIQKGADSNHQGTWETQKYIADQEIGFERYKWDNPQTTTIQDSEGNVYGYNSRNSTATAVTDENGQQIQGYPPRSQAIEQEIKTLGEQKRELIKSRPRILELLHNATLTGEEEEITAYRSMLAQIEAEIAGIDDRVNKLLEHRKSTQQQQKTTPATPAQPATTPTASNDVTPATTQTLGQNIGEDIPKIVGTASNVQQPQKQATNTAYVPPVVANGFDGIGNQQISKSLQNPPTPQITGRLSDDIPAIAGNSQPVSGDVTPAQTPPKQTTQPKLREVNVSDDMRYDPTRDKNISSDLIFTEEHFRNFIRDCLQDKRFAGMSLNQLIAWAYKSGIRIKK